MQRSRFFNFSIIMLLKDIKEHIFTVAIFSLLIFILSSVIFLSQSIKSDMLLTLENSPQITITNQQALFPHALNDEDIEKILLLRGVSEIKTEVNGMYHFLQADVDFKIISDEMLDNDSIIIGQGVKSVIDRFYYKNYFNFFTCRAKMIKLNIKGTFDKKSSIFSNNLIAMSEHNAREILGLKSDEYSTIKVYIPNDSEIDYIAKELYEIFPQANIVTKKERKSSIENLFYYKGGLFLIFYMTTLLSFVILLYKQASIISSKSSKEIGILRSLGFSINDIIKLKMIQHIIVSLSAFMIGFILAYIYVFKLGAPLLKKIFFGTLMELNISFTPYIDFEIVAILFAFSVLPYLATIIIPSWKVATSQMSDVLK